MIRERNQRPDSFIVRGQLNAVVALLLVLIGEAGQKELLKKRRANAGVIKFLSDQIGLSNKDLAAVLNTTESGISNLRSKRKRT